MVYLSLQSHLPSQVLTGLGVGQLCWFHTTC